MIKKNAGNKSVAAAGVPSVPCILQHTEQNFINFSLRLRIRFGRIRQQQSEAESNNIRLKFFFFFIIMKY